MRRIDVAAAVIVRDNRVLVTRKGNGDFVHLWEFPGGKIEEGESGEEAVSRELEEELHLSITVVRHLSDVEYDYPKFHLMMRCYVCCVTDGEVTLTEHEEARWVTLEELDSLCFLPADDLVVSEIKRQCVLS